MDILSNKTQRREEDAKQVKEFVKAVAFFALALTLIWLTTGCSTLNDHVAACYDIGGKPTYTHGGGFSGSTKFDCK